MKKILLGVLCIFLLLGVTGCGNNNSNGNGNSNNEFSCTQTISDEFYETTETLTVRVNNDYVERVEQVSVMEGDEEFIDMVYAFGELFALAFNEINGMSSNVERINDTSFRQTLVINVNSLDRDTLNDILGDLGAEDWLAFLMENERVTKEQFKAETLTNFNCN